MKAIRNAPYDASSPEFVAFLKDMKSALEEAQEKIKELEEKVAALEGAGG